MRFVECILGININLWATFESLAAHEAGNDDDDDDVDGDDH